MQQQYFIGVVVDTSRKATTVREGVVSIVVANELSQRQAIEQQHCKHPDPSPLARLVYVIVQAMFGQSTRLQQVSIPKQQTTVQPRDPGVFKEKSERA